MTTIQDVISRLRQPVPSLEELESLLIAPLVSLGVSVPTTSKVLRVASPNLRQLGTLQSTILAHVYPVWADETSLCELYFIPSKDAASDQTSAVTWPLVSNGLALLTTPPLSRFSIRLLEKFMQTYSLDDVWYMWRSVEKEASGGWDRALVSWMSIPGKVANALSGPGSNASRDIPNALSFEAHSSQTCLATERIIWDTAIEERPRMYVAIEGDIEKMTHLISKLISTGHFSQDSPSFIPLALSQITSRLAMTHAQKYADLWPRITANLSGPQLQTFTTSLLYWLDNGHLCRPMQFNSAPIRLHPSKALHILLGPASRAPSEVWHVIIGGGRTWSRELIRGIVGWVAGLGASPEIFDEKGLGILLEHVLNHWSDPQRVARALLSEHQYLTSIFLLVLGALTNHSSATPEDPPSDSFADSVLDLNDLDPLEPAAPSTSTGNGSTTPQAHPILVATSTSPPFLRAISAYLSQQDEAVRRCGMLAAEVVTSGRVNFGDWDGEKEWQKWAGELRHEFRDILEIVRKDIERATVIQKQDSDELIDQAPATEEPQADTPSGNTPVAKLKAVSEPDSDDDSLVGYDSPSPTSSRAPSPTPSELADPTLRRKAIPRPVYLAELGALLVEAPKNVVEVQPSENFGGGGKKVRRGLGISGGQGGDAEDEKGRVAMALEVGAELVRRKRGYGTEHDENAINLVRLFIALQDNFDLDHFDDRRQDVLVALVACCPTKSAPTIIEQFFHHQYSTAQRFTMLNALAIGARELAGLPVPPSSIAENDKRPRIDFPSKVLPGQAHLQYIMESDLPPSTDRFTPGQRRIEGMRSQVSSMVEDISGMTITRSKQDTEARVPQAVRERALKLGPRPSTSIVPLDSSSSRPPAAAAVGYLSTQTPVVPFSQVAAEYFVAPLINRFWIYLRGSLERESYGSGNRIGTGVRAGTGTGLILSPLVLGHFLDTLSVLLHAARHSPAFLHVLGPDAAELALTVGTQPMSKLKKQNQQKGRIVLKPRLEYWWVPWSSR
ncbi:telomere length regulation protein [Ceratobasidium sp. AG-Ba]|nr:telomere length regulation protein [Ceratobasidium sp. AG-Ba]